MDELVRKVLLTTLPFESNQRSYKLRYISNFHITPLISYYLYLCPIVFRRSVPNISIITNSINFFPNDSLRLVLWLSWLSMVRLKENYFSLSLSNGLYFADYIKFTHKWILSYLSRINKYTHTLKYKYFVWIIWKRWKTKGI